MMPLFVDSKSAFLFTSVLLIGPDSETVDVWARSLSRRGHSYCILKAYNADYGLEVLELKTLDCVVFDLDLPHAGFPALRRMIPDCLHTPLAVVALTEAKTKDVHELALYHGAHTCISKNLFEPCDLHRHVQDAISTAWKSRLDANA
ncbi:MAG TPA: response regulator [Nitrospira sp.]|nr:response regulator [Nitrospira sp.]